MVICEIRKERKKWQKSKKGRREGYNGRGKWMRIKWGTSEKDETMKWAALKVTCSTQVSSSFFFNTLKKMYSFSLPHSQLFYSPSFLLPLPSLSFVRRYTCLKYLLSFSFFTVLLLLCRLLWGVHMRNWLILVLESLVLNVRCSIVNQDS